MQVGAVLPQLEIGTDPEAIAHYGRTIEELGYDHVVIFDHVLGDRIADEAWSPARPLIGYTNTLGGQGIPGTPTEAKPVAIVRDPANGAVVAEVDGRFAGWSPDGAWFYVATSGGLYARPLAGGELVRVSGIGVPVSITKP